MQWTVWPGNSPALGVFQEEMEMQTDRLKFDGISVAMIALGVTIQTAVCLYFYYKTSGQ